MKAEAKLALIAVGSVILAGLAAVFIPQPYGSAAAGVIGVCGGLWTRSHFDNLKGV